MVRHMHRDSKWIVCAWVLLYLCACSPTLRINGEYYSLLNEDNPNKEMLSIGRDGSFSYKTWSDILGESRTSGTWRATSDTLYLAENYKDSLQAVGISEGVANNQPETRIVVLDGNKNPLAGALVSINVTDVYSQTDVNGSVVFSSQYIKSITVKYLSLVRVLNVQNYNSKNFVVVINFDKLNLKRSHLFHKWLIKNKKIIPIDDNGSVLKENAFKRSPLGKGIY